MFTITRFDLGNPEILGFYIVILTCFVFLLVHLIRKNSERISWAIEASDHDKVKKIKLNTKGLYIIMTIILILDISAGITFWTKVF